MICATLAILVEKKFQGQELRAIGGVYFLRMLCPAIITPETWCLYDKQTMEPVRWVLTNISRLLQLASNALTFKAGTVYAILNDWLAKNQPKIDGFLQGLGKIPSNWEDFVTKNDISPYNKNKICSEIHLELCAVLPQIAIALTKLDKGKTLDYLVKVLNCLGVPNSKIGLQLLPDNPFFIGNSSVGTLDSFDKYLTKDKNGHNSNIQNSKPELETVSNADLSLETN